MRLRDFSAFGFLLSYTLTLNICLTHVHHGENKFRSQGGMIFFLRKKCFLPHKLFSL